MEVPVKVEMEEDIPLTKAGYTITPTYAPIQVCASSNGSVMCDNLPGICPCFVESQGQA